MLCTAIYVEGLTCNEDILCKSLCKMTNWQAWRTKSCNRATYFLTNLLGKFYKEYIIQTPLGIGDSLPHRQTPFKSLLREFTFGTLGQGTLLLRRLFYRFSIFGFLFGACSLNISYRGYTFNLGFSSLVSSTLWCTVKFYRRILCLCWATRRDRERRWVVNKNANKVL